MKALRGHPVKVFKKKNHQRNPKGEGQDQGHETTEGEGDIDQETIDIDGMNPICYIFWLLNF